LTFIIQLLILFVGLPRPVLRYLGYQLSPLHLRRLEVALDTPLGKTLIHCNIMVIFTCI